VNLTNPSTGIGYQSAQQYLGQSTTLAGASPPPATNLYGLPVLSGPLLATSKYVVSVEKVESLDYAELARRDADRLAARYSGNDPVERLINGAVQVGGGFTVMLGQIANSATRSDPSYRVIYNDGSWVYSMGEGTTTESLANIATMAAPPGFSGASRPARQLTLRTPKPPPTSITTSNNGLNIVNPRFEPTGRTIVSAVAQEQADRGAAGLVQSMSRRQADAYLNNPAAGSRFLGRVVHERTAAEVLGEAYGGRFKYNRVGPDFFDNSTGQYIELTTPGQVVPHLSRGGPYTNAEYATYVLPRTQP
jgi:hypothetical protein